MIKQKILENVVNNSNLDLNILLEEERIKALEEGEAVSYVNLCNGLGVTPENPELYERGMAEILIDKKGLGSFVGLTKNREPSKKPDQVSKYRVLYEVGMELQINPDNIFVDTQTKIRLLREYMGYTKLIGAGGEKVLIDDAKATRIGAVFKDCFYRGREAYTQGK